MSKTLTIGNNKKDLILKTGLNKIAIRVLGTIPSGNKVTINAYPAFFGTSNWSEVAILNANTSYTLTKKPILKIDSITLDGTEITDYTFNKITGEITFGTSLTGNLNVQYQPIDADTVSYATQEITGDGSLMIKTFVFDLIGIPYAAFVFESDAINEFDIEVL